MFCKVHKKYIRSIILLLPLLLTKHTPNLANQRLKSNKAQTHKSPRKNNKSHKDFLKNSLLVTGGSLTGYFFNKYFISDEQNQINFCNQKINQLKAENKKLKNTPKKNLQEIANLHQQSQALQKLQQDYSNQNTGLQQKNQQLKEKKDQISKNLDASNKNIIEQKKKINSLNQQLGQFDQSRKNLVNTQNENVELKNQINNLGQQLKTLRDQNTDLQQENKQLKQEKDQISKNLDASNKNIKEQKKKINSLNQQLNQFDQSNFKKQSNSKRQKNRSNLKTSTKKKNFKKVSKANIDNDIDEKYDLTSCNGNNALLEIKPKNKNHRNNHNNLTANATAIIGLENIEHVQSDCDESDSNLGHSSKENDYQNPLALSWDKIDAKEIENSSAICGHSKKKLGNTQNQNIGKETYDDTDEKEEPTIFNELSESVVGVNKKDQEESHQGSQDYKEDIFRKGEAFTVLVGWAESINEKKGCFNKKELITTEHLHAYYKNKKENENKNKNKNELEDIITLDKMIYFVEKNQLEAIKIKVDHEGLVSFLFTSKRRTNEIFLAYRGTEFSFPMITPSVQRDCEWKFGKLYCPKGVIGLNSFKKNWHHVEEALREEITEKANLCQEKKITLHILGHSLGGVDAQHTLPFILK